MDYIANYILGQRTQLETRLLAERREVYDYYDRLKESASLRGSLSPAILVLGFAISVRLMLDSQPLLLATLLVLITTGISYALAIRGREQFHKSTEALSTAVIIGAIRSPRIEAWEAEIGRIEAQVQSRPSEELPSPGTS
jgi:hypothetical protein